MVGGKNRGMSRGEVHHLELWVPDLARAVDAWGWLLETLGYTEFQRWEGGRSWKRGPMYLVVEQSPAMTDAVHERRRAGLNHLALHVGDRDDLDALMAAAGDHGWTALFAERYPHAGGADHVAGFLENADGFEVELVTSG